jgi:hypothetical protein
MKRLLLAMVFLAAGTAWAEWVRMGEDSGQITHYFDPKTIGKEGDLRTVRWLEEFRTKDATGVLSTRSMYEFDCQQQRRRTLAFSSHPERWANGRTISSGHRPSNWEAVPVDSFADAFRKLVCTR